MLLRLEAVPLEALGTGSAGNIVQHCVQYRFVFRAGFGQFDVDLKNQTCILPPMALQTGEQTSGGASMLGEDKRQLQVHENKSGVCVHLPGSH